MGFFSKQCEECGYSLLSPYATNHINTWMTEAVAITSEGRVIAGTYDGYGTIGGDEAMCDDVDVFENVTVYHRACWTIVGEPTDYRGPSEWAEDQGYFFDEADYNVARPDGQIPVRV